MEPSDYRLINFISVIISSLCQLLVVDVELIKKKLKKEREKEAIFAHFVFSVLTLSENHHLKKINFNLKNLKI
jgi:hypothetical protein